MKIIKNLTFAALAALAIALVVQTPSARADNHGAATINFIKWVTALNPRPGVLADMEGIIVGADVGGDVGDGTFIGEILLNEPTATGRHIVADYHLHGSKHSFTARVNVLQTGVGRGAHAVITGVVTDGWLKDHAVDGEYTIIPPCVGTVNCIEVTLDIIKRHSND
jgi:hypothetical protein